MMQANGFMSQNIHNWMAIWDYVLVALWSPIARRNGNVIGSCLRCCSEDTGTLSGDFAASSTDNACPDAPPCRSGKISACRL